MTFRCRKCGEVSEPKEPAHVIVVATREHQHPFRDGAMRDGNNDPGGMGKQITKELIVCEECSNLLVIEKMAK